MRSASSGREERRAGSNPSSILFQNDAKTVVVIDIPRSIEEAQVPSGSVAERKIFSATPVSSPFQLPEPKDADEQQMSLLPGDLLSELTTADRVQTALDEVQSDYSGPLCLPRVMEPTVVREDGDEQEGDNVLLPPSSHHLHGSIQDLRSEFSLTAPQFDLIIMDPPWPNRSARRKRKNYSTAHSLPEIQSLLSTIPVPTHLSPSGLLAVWITNKHSIRRLLTAPDGLLASWGLELLSEWVWIKVTTGGEPIFDMASSYRKPWERLLIAGRRGKRSGVEGKVLVGVPDLHSRKPNLRAVFDGLLPDGYSALEVFARNLTAGWWSWGDEVLLFQGKKFWTAAAGDA